MAGRPVDHQRRAELLDAVVDYTVEHGFSEVSWRPVAAALGVSPTTLVHRFGTKEQMLVAILGRLRERIFAATKIEVGGVEYVVDDRDGKLYYYDINALSNFVSDGPTLIGFDPFARLVDYLQQEAA